MEEVYKELEKDSKNVEVSVRILLEMKKHFTWDFIFLLYEMHIKLNAHFGCMSAYEHFVGDGGG